MVKKRISSRHPWAL